MSAAAVLVISGSMGAGKTTVVGEASDVLAAHGIVHAALDFDWLGSVYLPGGSATRLAEQNLAAVWRNYTRTGIERLLLAAALESAQELAAIRRAAAGADLTVCRLRARIETMEERVRLREPGMLRDRYVARTRALEAALDIAALEDFEVINESRSITDVAREVLARARWLP